MLPMNEHVARALCRAAVNGERCPFCEPEEECQMWDSFAQEAEAAIQAVRDYARLDMRNKPRKRS